MKKLLATSILVGILALPLVGFAATCGDNKCEPPGENPSNCPGDCGVPETDVMTVLDSVTNWMFVILLVAAVIFILLAAYYFVTAAGSPEQVTKARNFVLYALVGVLVAFMARGLVTLINTIVNPSSQPSPPSHQTPLPPPSGPPYP